MGSALTSPTIPCSAFCSSARAFRIATLIASCSAACQKENTRDAKRNDGEVEFKMQSTHASAGLDRTSDSVGFGTSFSINLQKASCNLIATVSLTGSMIELPTPAADKSSGHNPTRSKLTCSALFGTLLGSSMDFSNSAASMLTRWSQCGEPPVSRRRMNRRKNQDIRMKMVF